MSEDNKDCIFKDCVDTGDCEVVIQNMMKTVMETEYSKGYHVGWKEAQATIDMLANALEYYVNPEVGLELETQAAAEYALKQLKKNDSGGVDQSSVRPGQQEGDASDESIPGPPGPESKSITVPFKIFFKWDEEANGYDVWSDQVADLVTCGTTIQEAKENYIDALMLHLAPIPEEKPDE